MSERIVDRPGLNTPAEDAAWNALRERVTISLRPIGAPTSIGFFGLAAASLVLSALQLSWVEPGESREVALELIGFVFLAQLLAAIFSYLGRDGIAGTGTATLALIWLVVGLTLYTAQPGATSALPLGRRGKGKVAVQGSLLEQVQQIATRPGVRQQL